MRISENGKTLYADEGKVFRCKCHNVILGTEVYLRQIMKDGVLVDDSADNYEEIDDPERPEIEKTEEAEALEAEAVESTKETEVSEEK